jgi:hypothetical protein
MCKLGTRKPDGIIQFESGGLKYRGDNEVNPDLRAREYI